ncbi:unnamed protein product [Vitrella brassicaformis CCMP3155]|uniref:C3H1-type domain-containing protein n=1 Tax=Vitrella brassicaformis (strain CCMP3155) TaxID=1169540 RepID=A0A0G4GTZ7_VITBC|nr:unnamed protein product [Vitrella brassicaformis CCMP3155]|eukprot:CEM34246.1 unnamed protein product [Vitrella brassicaformis CCMP3155]
MVALPHARCVHQGECTRGENCRCAHSLEEVRTRPDLTKTRLCENFQKGECSDPNCAYAHGEDELRSTDDFYKTSLCVFWKRGTNCSRPHLEELLEER